MRVMDFRSLESDCAADTKLVILNDVSATKKAAKEEAANRFRRLHTASLSHDLRTPLNSVISSNELAAQHLPPQHRQLLHVSIASCRFLLTLVDDILDLSKIEVGKIDIEKSAFDLRECIRDVVGVVEVQALLKKLQI